MDLERFDERKRLNGSIGFQVDEDFEVLEMSDERSLVGFNGLQKRKLFV